MAVKANSNTVGNIDLLKLLSAPNQNMTAEIDLIDLVKLKTVNFFFVAVKFETVAEVHIKRYNRQKLETAVPILREVEEIMNPGIHPNPIDYEKQNNTITNAKIKRECAISGTKPIYKIINAEQFEIIKKAQIEFAHFAKNDGKINVVFSPENADKINFALGITAKSDTNSTNLTSN
ncbi:MAG: hypothetical protein LBN95_06120 [Prevotellaceae bacterium]|jgi:hypothetical protein|nr:hypothetical protein [Prevotellaceae bacterium]